MKTIKRQCIRATPKLDSTVYHRAMKRLMNESNYWSCSAIYFVDGNTVKERAFYQHLFSIKPGQVWFNHAQASPRTQNIRLMAVALAATLAEEQNRSTHNLFDWIKAD